MTPFLRNEAHRLTRSRITRGVVLFDRCFDPVADASVLPCRLEEKAMQKHGSRRQEEAEKKETIDKQALEEDRQRTLPPFSASASDVPGGCLPSSSSVWRIGQSVPVSLDPLNRCAAQGGLRSPWQPSVQLNSDVKGRLINSLWRHTERLLDSTQCTWPFFPVPPESLDRFGGTRRHEKHGHLANYPCFTVPNVRSSVLSAAQCISAWGLPTRCKMCLARAQPSTHMFMAVGTVFRTFTS